MPSGLTRPRRMEMMSQGFSQLIVGSRLPMERSSFPIITKGKEKMTLEIYCNGNDWVVAESSEDANKVYCDWSGQSFDDQDDQEVGDWEPISLNGDDLFTIIHDCLPNELNLEDLPEGATAVKAQRGTEVTATVSAWIFHNGRGFLCSLDW